MPIILVSEMEDFGGYNIRTNAKEILKKYGPMTSGEIAHMLEPDADYSGARYRHLKNRIGMFFVQDKNRYQEIEIIGKKKNERTHQYENVYKWVGN